MSAGGAGWRVTAGPAPGTGHTKAELPGGLLLLAVTEHKVAIRAAAHCFPAAPGTLAGWQWSTRAFAEACLRNREGSTLVAAVLGPPYLGFVCAGDGFLVLERTPGGSMPLAAPGRHGVLADRAITGVALCAGGDDRSMLTAERRL
jgi:hypothetical protein